ncbi:unnamed protein product [Caenorhabditis auriculariae]|uniref:Hypoxanthine phosphoribosyltransferase n=1 Tax=Caenorhabditis auriculariae TaxID=2777116 RepID=A0A8S1GNS3_9PELO|nr:unnamed protein product [Caenorhabditis auriculariae]
MAQARVVIPDDFELPVGAFDIPRCYDGDLSAVVISEGMIKDRVRRLAKDIHQTIGDEPLALLCVLKGSYKFFTALVDELSNARYNCPEPMTVDFIRVRSYEDQASTGKIEIMGMSNLNELKDKNVLVVDDISDTGRTLDKLLKTLIETGVKKTWTALLLSKKVKRFVEVAEDFVAFDIPDKFIVGYGLDYNQKFRDLNHICMDDTNLKANNIQSKSAFLDEQLKVLNEEKKALDQILQSLRHQKWALATEHERLLTLQQHQDQTGVSVIKLEEKPSLTSL